MLPEEYIHGLVGAMVGLVGAAARWFSEIMNGRSKWNAANFIFVIVMGGFMGFMGTALAQATGHENWSNVLSGALGASGAYGFDFIMKRVFGAAGL